MWDRSEHVAHPECEQRRPSRTIAIVAFVLALAFIYGIIFGVSITKS